MKKLLSIMLLGGALALSGCGNSNNYDYGGIIGGPVLAPPTCADDAYTTNANKALTVPAATGVLANDTPNGATLTFSATSAQGGTITGAQDGSFTYSPPANFSGTDSFTYTLGNSGGVVTCKVTITVVAVNGFFVDAATGSDTTGSFTNGLPFATVQAAVAAAGTNQDIVVRPGSYTGTVTLKNGQRLLGSGSVLAQGVVRPTLSGPIDMADGNTIDFIKVSGTAGDAIDGSGQNGGTVTNCEISNITNSGNGLRGTSISGSWTFSNNTVSSTAGVSVFLTTDSSSTAVLRINSNTISTTMGAIGLVSDGSSQVNAQVTSNTLSGNTGAGATFELTCGGSSTFCLDLESNSNDDRYRLVETDTPSELSVEQLSLLDTPKPTGAGNTGTISIGTGTGFDPIADVANGTCGF